jgi:hypothetical protein
MYAKLPKENDQLLIFVVSLRRNGWRRMLSRRMSDPPQLPHRLLLERDRSADSK